MDKTHHSGWLTISPRSALDRFATKPREPCVLPLFVRVRIQFLLRPSKHVIGYSIYIHIHNNKCLLKSIHTQLFVHVSDSPEGIGM